MEFDGQENGNRSKSGRRLRRGCHANGNKSVLPPLMVIDLSIYVVDPIIYSGFIKKKTLTCEINIFHNNKRENCYINRCKLNPIYIGKTYFIFINSDLPIETFNSKICYNRRLFSNSN